MLMNCDTLFMIGTSFPYAEWLPPEGSAKCVEIDIDGSLIGVRYPNDVSLVGDSKDTLQALLPMLKRKADRDWQEYIEKEVETWWRVLDDRAHEKGDPINPQLVFNELDKRLADDTVMTSDSGSATNWWARHIRMRGEMRGSLSGTLATMVPGVPYAIGAKFAFPERPVIAFSGDGAFQMLGMNELLTVKSYLHELCDKNPTLIFAVLVNEDLNQVSFEQRVMGADPKNPETQTLPYVPAAEFAKLLGFEGIKVTKPKDVGPAWDQALAADKPVLLEFVTDRQIPPLPPHVRPEQLKGTAKALLARRRGRGRDRHQGLQGQGGRGQGAPAGSRQVSVSAPLRARPDVTVDAVEASAFSIPTDGGPEQDGTLSWDSTTLRARDGAGRRRHRARVLLHPPGCRRGRQRHPRRRRQRRRPHAGRRRLGRHVARRPQRRADRRGGHGDLRGRRRAVGPQGPVARPPAWSTCSTPSTTRCRSTAAAGSATTPMPSSPTSSPGGSRPAFPA